MPMHAKKKTKRRYPAGIEAFAGTSGVDASDHSFTAKLQHDHLAAAVQNWKRDCDSDTASVAQIPCAEHPPADTDESSQLTKYLGRLKTIKPSAVLKSLLAMLAIFALGWTPLQRLLATTSAQAVINARVITVRAPIAGTIAYAFENLEVGTSFPSGEKLLTIRNPRSDRTNLNNLKRIAEQLSTTIASLKAKKQALESQHRKLSVQNDRFRTGRIATLEKRRNEIDTQILAAIAQHKDMAAILARTRALFAKGIIAETALDKAKRDESVALQTIKGSRERRNAVQVELAAARDGTFVSDGYSDTPQSAQRRLDVAVELAEVSARLKGTLNELAAVKQDLVAETKRHEELSTAIIRASMPGRIWEVMTAPGEYVNAGQVLMRMLDCDSAIVTANVSESVYQRLRIGQQATFTPRESGEKIKGWIVDLTGLAAVASNDAIQPKLLSREPYHVTLRFPGLARMGCQISRSGLVTFNTSASSPAHESSATRTDVVR